MFNYLNMLISYQSPVKNIFSLCFCMLNHKFDQLFANKHIVLKQNQFAIFTRITVMDITKATNIQTIKHVKTINHQSG